MNDRTEKKIFPIEITQFSYESLFVKNHTSSRIIYLTVLGMFLTGLALLPVIKIDVSSQSRGVIRSHINNNVIYSPKYGTVNHIKLHENMDISKNDTIIIIDSYEVDEQINLLNKQIDVIFRQSNDLNSLTQNESANAKFQSQKYLKEWISHQEEKKDLEIKKEFLEREYYIIKQLYEAGVNSLSEFKEVEYQLNIAKQNIEVFTKKHQNIWQSEQHQLKLQYQDLQSHKRRLIKEKEKYVLLSPMDGVIVNYSGIQEGNVIAPNLKIAEISILKNLVVESYVSPSDIGLISQNMLVKFQIDAYHYNQWGLATGKVIDISKDLVTIQDNPVFIVRCSIDQKHLTLKNKFKGQLTKGLTLTSRFMIARRSLYQLLFDKVDDWLNPHFID